MAEGHVERRLAAILAADVVGYSRSMQRDETGTLKRLKSLRSDVFDPRVEQFGGRIFKTTGDGALAEFRSTVDAVQCAVEIQQARGSFETSSTSIGSPVWATRPAIPSPRLISLSSVYLAERPFCTR